ncbi:HDIG domain-containing metalloprotein [Actinomadura sp. NPDC047616]|uniref:HDIG domain-containing metalloprotein n=1 Tax=Actinomadura sp. NPDC047616 TaxID=3155914 RepID=UPI0033D4470B
MRLPSDREIRALHEKYAPTPEAFELVYTHCQIVCEIAEQFLSRDTLDLDAELVRAGSLLHDIGVYLLYTPSGELDHAGYIRHGVLGHELLRDLGFPEFLCRFCSCHTGVGLTRDDVRAQSLPIPEADYPPETGEEELVLYADKFHSKTTPPTFVTPATYTQKIRRFGDSKAQRFTQLRAHYGDPDLTPLATAYGHTVV